MWRFWNCVPRFVRQQFHGPRASAGVCVEEEKGDHEVEKLVLSESVQGHQDATHQHYGAADKDSERHGCRWKKHHQQRQYRCGFRSQRKQSLQETEQQEETGHNGSDQRKANCRGQFWSPFHGQGRASEYRHRHWWKQRCHGHFWSERWNQQRSLDAITWGTAMVFALQLSRKPQLQQVFEVLTDPDKRHQWWNLLLRVAFSTPPEAAGVSVQRSIVQGLLPQKQDTEDRHEDGAKDVRQNVSETVESNSEETKTLSDVMHDFELSCQKYAALASSVSGVLAAEQGQMAAAMEHLQLACRLGHAPAYFNLAVCYEMGLGVEKDPKQAAVYYQMAAEAGHARSIYNLALMTLKGEGGLTKDRAKAIELLTKAAKRGLAQAQTYLGVYYTEDEDDQQDFEQAASFFRAAASQNDAEAQYFLGICYENGWGVESSDEEAGRLYSAAADLGHDGALYNLAAFYEYGLGGLKQDKEEAMALYQRSAEHGNQSAKFRLEEEEARKAVDMWSEENSGPGVEQSQGLHRQSHSSSPVLTDFMRESIAGIWSGELSAWFSSQSLTSSSKLSNKQRPTFPLGDYGSVSSLDQGDGETDSSLMDFPQRVGIAECVAGMHRTSTMPELRMISCQ